MLAEKSILAVKKHHFRGSTRILENEHVARYRDYFLNRQELSASTIVRLEHLRSFAGLAEHANSKSTLNAVVR